MSNRKMVFILSLLALLSSLFNVRFSQVEVKASNGYRVHNINSGLNYTTIQGAMDAPQTLDGHTILVDAGIYFEHVIITKSISLIGEERDTTIIDGSETGTTIRISKNNVNIINLTIRNAGRNWGPPPGYGYPDCCIIGRNVGHVHIENDTFTGAAVCVAFTDYSSFVNISTNTVSDATYIGILAYGSHNITIYHNFIFDYGSEGIHLDGGPTYCKIVNNTVKNGFAGISLEKPATARNLIEGNHLIDNNASIGLYGCGTNVFRRNNTTSNQYNLLIWGYDPANFMQDIDDSNIVNNKTLYYLTNRHNLLIDPLNYPNLGYIAIVNCTNIVIRDFNITRNGDGILLACSTNCTLMNITLSDNRGSLIYGGLMFFESNNNTIVNSRICNNSYGVCLYYSDWNIFYHNSFIHNDRQVISDFLSPFRNMSSGVFSANVWDNGTEGNYWSDYAGGDLDYDGIGNTAHIIDSKNQDNHPLMGIFYNFEVTVEGGKVYNVQVASNSSVRDLTVLRWLLSPNQYLQPGQKFIRFLLAGMENTTGFCRVTIPRAVLNGTYIVLIDWTEVQANELPVSNSTYAYLYFTYNHTEHEVIIIPDFPSLLFSPLFMIATLLAAIVYRRKPSR